MKSAFNSTSRFASLAIAAALAVVLVAAPSAQGEFANTRDLGRAVTQYKDNTFQVVTAYNFSQRQHDMRWIMIQMAVMTTSPMRFRREGIFLKTPDGRVIELATQRRFREDIQRITELLQRASTTRHAVDSYFNVRDLSEGMRFFAQPSQGSVQDEFVTGIDRLMIGDLFFENPRGLWEKGVHTLTVQSDRAKVELPITLE